MLVYVSVCINKQLQSFCPVMTARLKFPQASCFNSLVFSIALSEQMQWFTSLYQDALVLFSVILERLDINA